MARLQRRARSVLRRMFGYLADSSLLADSPPAVEDEDAGQADVPSGPDPDSAKPTKKHIQPPDRPMAKVSHEREWPAASEATRDTFTELLRMSPQRVLAIGLTERLPGSRYAYKALWIPGLLTALLCMSPVEWWGFG